jgi:hypothetical protein
VALFQRRLQRRFAKFSKKINATKTDINFFFVATLQGSRQQYRHCVAGGHIRIGLIFNRLWKKTSERFSISRTENIHDQLFQQII